MPEPVDSSSPQETVGECIGPFWQIEVAGDNGGSAFIAFGYNIVEVLVLGWAKGFESKVINDEQTGRGEILKRAFVGVGRSGGMEFTEHLALGNEKHVAADTESAVSESLGEVAFARTTGTEDENADSFIHEATGCQIQDKGFVDLRVKRKVKLLNGFVIAEGGAAQGKGEFFLCSSSHFILQYHSKKVGVGELFFNGLAVSCLQGIKHAGKPQFFEHGD